MTLQTESTQQVIFALAHQTYSKGLNLHAFFKLNSHELGEDLVQETFYKTWSYLVKGNDIEKMQAFLYHILNKLIIDEYRKSSRKSISLDEIIEKGYDPEHIQERDVSDFFEGEKLFILIPKLPKAYQKIMKMRYVDDLSLQEIADIYKKSKNSVTVKIHRGLAKLKILYLN